MEDVKNEKRAIEVYETLCSALDKLNFKYEKEGKDADGDYTVRFSGVGEDLPMEFVMFCDVGRQLVRVMSQMPFAFSQDKQIGRASCRERV